MGHQIVDRVEAAESKGVVETAVTAWWRREWVVTCPIE